MTAIALGPATLNAREPRWIRGVLTAADRHLARYFKYVEEFPTAACG